MREIPTDEIIRRLKGKDRTVLGKAITIVENGLEGRTALLNYAWQASARQDCLVIGLTGAGGAGKSTLVDKLIWAYREAGLQVGVIAVDPSSPYTGGALLGDRIRMSGHNRDAGVFIRSFATRGLSGGLSCAAKDALYLYKAFGFPVILVESVGIGQSDTEIEHFVDVTAVVMAPGNGDSIQMAKAGTQEAADIFVVNKADRPEAELLEQQLRAAFDPLPEDRRPCIVKTSARDDTGIRELLPLFAETAEKHRDLRDTKQRLRIENEIYTGALQLLEPALRQRIRAQAESVLRGETTPFDAAVQIGSDIELR